jgi:hypothetical protein
MAGWSVRGVHVPTGTRIPIDGGSINAIVRRTALPARCDTYKGVDGDLAAHLAAPGHPLRGRRPVVDRGPVWGALIAEPTSPSRWRPGPSTGLASFAELIATACRQRHRALGAVASRARIVEAADEQRRRVVRDLHDGAQQRSRPDVMTLQLAHGRATATSPGSIDERLEAARARPRRAARARPRHPPAILTHHGLAAAVEALADRAPLPVQVDVPSSASPAPSSRRPTSWSRRR